MWLSVGNHGRRHCPLASAFTLDRQDARYAPLQAKAKTWSRKRATICPPVKPLSPRASNGTSPNPGRCPDGWVNNAFLDWDGRATVSIGPTVNSPSKWQPIGRSRSTSSIRRLREVDLFCFEPVTHAVDAHNASGGPEANGLSDPCAAGILCRCLRLVASLRWPMRHALAESWLSKQST